MKRCGFCSNVIEDDIVKCPYCGYETQADDFSNQETAIISPEQYTDDYSSYTPYVNKDVGANGFLKNQNSTNYGTAYQTSDYASGINQSDILFQQTFPQASKAMPWKIYYKTNANSATKVAVIICAVFCFFAFCMEIVQLISLFATNAYFNLSAFLIVVLASELIAYVGGGVLMLLIKKWWVAAIICGVAFSLMVYNLVVNRIFSSYLVVAFSVWAIVSLILLNKKYKNEVN